MMGLLAVLRSSTPRTHAQLCMAGQRYMRAASTPHQSLSICDVASISYGANARYQDRAQRHSIIISNKGLENCEAPFLEERFGLRRQQILHIDRGHAVGRAGEDRHRIDDRRVR